MLPRSATSFRYLSAFTFGNSLRSSMCFCWLHTIYLLYSQISYFRQIEFALLLCYEAQRPLAMFSTVSTEYYRPPRIPATVRLSGSIVISESYMKFGRWMREHQFLLKPFFPFAQRVVCTCQWGWWGKWGVSVGHSESGIDHKRGEGNPNPTTSDDINLISSQIFFKKLLCSFLDSLNNILSLRKWHQTPLQEKAITSKTTGSPKVCTRKLQSKAQRL